MDSNLKREIIIDNYENPFHKDVKNEKEFIKANTNNESCIDNIDLYVKVKDDIIVDAYFDGEACAITTSATSIMVRKIIGLTVLDARKLMNEYYAMINEENYNKDTLEELVVYSDIAKQLDDRSINFDKIYEGAQRFIIGLSKKVLIANQLGEFCDIFREINDKTVLFYWAYAVAFTLHIYFDFSGYSDMAIGLGKIFGFSFLENFNYPYISKSITEFWRRWHMSLGTWFRDYVYIPLGGNRVSKTRHFINIFVVWMLTGFWHGASWNFILWGLLFAILLMVEKFVFSKNFEVKKNVMTELFKHIYVLFFVIISFVIFNAQNLSQAANDIGGMFGVGGQALISEETLYYLRSYGVVFILAVIGSLPVLKNAVTKLSESKVVGNFVEMAKPVVVAVLLLLSTAYLVDGSFNPFLYFRF